MKLTPEQAEWFADAKAKDEKAHNPNPLVGIYGPGPLGRHCYDCKRLFVHECSKRYYKCELRKFTNGPGSDHKMRWDACGKFEQK